MFYIRDEGEQIKNGFNFYPDGSGSIGFVLRIKQTSYFVRYAKKLQKMKFHTKKDS